MFPFRMQFSSLKTMMSTTFSETVIKSSVNGVKESINNVIDISDENFPSVSESHVRFKKKSHSHNFLRRKNIFISPKQMPHPVPDNKEYATPNGSFLKYMTENTYA